ncbi:MAG: hypothetical protein BJG00_012200 [Limnothrix sp. CACIAM 69d]|nr:MAG: hypothetical protein BJG00_012200 [Limnothrix sp. CACIAM 69d]
MKRPQIYQQLLIVSVLFTALSGGAATYLASQPQINPQQSELFQTFKGLFEKGVLGIGGLVLGKMAGYFPPQPPSDPDNNADQ